MLHRLVHRGLWQILLLGLLLLLLLLLLTTLLEGIVGLERLELIGDVRLEAAIGQLIVGAMVEGRIVIDLRLLLDLLGLVCRQRGRRQRGRRQGGSSRLLRDLWRADRCLDASPRRARRGTASFLRHLRPAKLN